MTGFNLEQFAFDEVVVAEWRDAHLKHVNWPVVYILDDNRDIYVGESLNGAARLKQHLASDSKRHLKRAQVIIDDTFNKSACLDLESMLIRLFAGDGKYRVLNRNDGITDAEYYERSSYQRAFDEVFDALKSADYFTRSVPEIENSDLFKLSPFKALTNDQAIAVEDILDGLFDDLEQDEHSTIVVQGNPGTGKTVLAIYLIKLLEDIRAYQGGGEPEGDSMFSSFFTSEHREILRDFRVGLVIPQQSLRASIQSVFARTPGLDPAMVLTPFQVGRSEQRFDLLIVDEAHRLNQRSAQAMGTLTKQFGEINTHLFGPDGGNRSQLDWMQFQSNHQIFLVDADQTVRPADLPRATLQGLAREAEQRRRWYPLTTQMRVKAGSDYVRYMKELLAGQMPDPQDFGEYDLRLFDDFDAMYEQIKRREDEVGLARLVAGYAWKWRSRKNRAEHDIELGSHKLQWNTTTKDWINSRNSTREVGSIHTVQGYDLNYAGVIIGGDLKFDVSSGATAFVRERYFDAKGKANNNFLGMKYTDADLLDYVRNIYAVLLTRGIRGTYIYVEDPGLRKHFFTALQGRG